ncbi:hypothetical protein [uncultured Sphaerochaeta sp.]|uniref:hypothetical protein n=1 Tax=uncultured Sphaerochaeta sp. TaxID=886478 RepID=UPI002A0A4843|nr:hypothetical protein [uncultured Sphaerochaeta sp.]
MDNLLGTLIYKITGDNSALDKSLDVSRGKLDKTGSSIEKMGTSIMRVSKTIISGMLVKSLLEASSRATELENKFDTVFKGVEAQTTAWVKDYASATNRGIIATKEFLSTQQDLRTGYGDSIASAAEYSKSVVGITNDLASFSNVPITEAMAAMQSGLSFQFEALRRLGVSISVATINQSDYARSIGKTWDQMSNLQKQEAVLSGVVSQSKNALHQDVQLWQDYDYTLGDAAKTSDSFANSSQGAKQKLDDLAAELGDALIPAASAFLGVGIDVMEMFNSWPDAAKAATSATIALAVAMAMVEGPVGIALGSVAALTVLISSAKDPSEKLASATRQLSEATGGYNELTKQLAGNTDNLTTSERNLLEARKAILGLEVQKNLAAVVKGYDETSSEIKKYEKSVEEAQARQDAYSLAVSKGPSAVREEIKKLEKQATMSSSEKTYYDVLKESLMQFTLRSKSAIVDWEKGLKDATNDLAQGQSDLATSQKGLEEAVLSAATAVNSGAVSVEYLAQSYPELYSQIMTMAQGLKVNTDATDANKKAIVAATFAATDWQKKTKELQSDQAEQSGEYQKAAQIKRSLLVQEKEEAIQKLATDAMLIKEGENATTLSIEELRKRISGNAAANSELKAMDIAFASDLKKIDNDAAQSARDAANKIIESKREQEASAKEALASELEGLGWIEASYRVKLEVLQEERAAERAILAQKVADNKATQEELDAYDKVSSSKEVELRKETDRKLISERLSAAKETKKLLNDQMDGIKEKKAEELEAAGSFSQATAIRVALIQQERDKDLLAMQAKVANSTATQEEINNLKTYYATKEDQLRKDQEKKEKEYQQSLKNSIASTLRSQQASVKQSLASELEGLGWIEASYRVKLEVLQEERAAERAILAQKVADNKATQEELDAYDKVSSSKEVELRKETDRKLISERLSAAKETKELLNDQMDGIKEKKAEELEAAGSFGDATAIRLDLMEQEKTKALQAMQAKVANNTATQQQLDDINTYYATKEEQLQKEQTDKIKDYWKDTVSSIASYMSTLSSDLKDLWSAQTDAQLDEIDKQTEKKLAALGLQDQTEMEKLQDEYKAAVEAGDMELAQEKSNAIEKQRIEDEADKKKQLLQIEQAQREKELNLFMAGLNMATAIIKALADPGGWAGVGLSVAAGVTGALEIAKIQAEPLPSFAVGANYIPEDMLSLVHKGETILPAPMAESVRKGEASFGSTSSNVTVNVINNTGAEVTQEETATEDGKEYNIIIGKTIDKQISEGRYDKSLGNRYGIKRKGIHA